jgi:hypothetical protein
MPHNLAPNEVYRVTFGFSSDQGRPALPSIHILIANVVALGPTDQDLANYYDSLMGPLLKGLITNQAAYLGCRVSIENRTPRFAFVNAVSNAGAGSAGSTPLPDQCAALFSFRTALAGRPYRGRFYLPFLDEASVTTPPGQQWTPATLAAFVTAAANMPAAQTIVASGGTVQTIGCVFHRTTAKGGTPVKGSFDPITLAVVKPAIATQRRRSLFRAAHR